LLDPYAVELTALGEPFEWVEKDALAGKLGPAHFHCAIHAPRSVLANPAALTRRLADTLPEYVSIFENSPAFEMDYSKDVKATTQGGSITAPRMILAISSGLAKTLVSIWPIAVM
jgi:glycine/D-amino acid oxidase-like deaminating enzyme